jgi:hypothetical protein
MDGWFPTIFCGFHKIRTICGFLKGAVQDHQDLKQNKSR